MKNIAFLFISLLWIQPLFAQETPAKEASETPAEQTTWEKVKEGSEKAYDYTAEKAKAAAAALNESKTNRGASHWTITGNYSMFETWVLSKYGVTAGYISSPNLTYELEFMKGSIGLGKFGIDIGEISEKRLSFNLRSYSQRNAFNFIYGIYYNLLEAQLGNELLDSTTAANRESLEIMRLATVGVTWGLGNRWQTKGGFVWGADWFAIHIPVAIVEDHSPYMHESSSEEDRKKAQDNWDTFKKIPEFAVVKVQLGVSF